MPLQSLRYDDNTPWPTEADGDGYSLVLIAPESAPDHELPQNWRASVNPGGDAGSSDTIPFEGDPESDLFAYVLGDQGEVDLYNFEGKPTFVFPRVLGADDATVSVEVSDNLVNWHAGEAVLIDQSERAGNTTMLRWALGTGGDVRQFVRLSVSINQ